MEDARKAKNRGSAQKSRDGERQRLGEDEYKRRRADAEKVRRKKMKEEEEIAAVADPALDHLAETRNHYYNGRRGGLVGEALNNFS